MAQSKRDKAIILAQKNTGLNKVTIKSVGDKYQAMMNGKKIYAPTSRATALKHAKALRIDAKHHDKSGHKLNQ
jgi:hypothetical protein